MNPIDIMKAVFALLGTCIAVIFGITHEQNKQKKEELKSVKKARKIEAENSKLTTDELIDRKL